MEHVDVGLSLNLVLKSKEFLITLRHKAASPGSLLGIFSKTTARHCGIVFDDKLSFADHIGSSCSIVNRSVGMKTEL